MTRRVLVLLLATLAAALLSGCLAMPSSGPVVETPGEGGVSDAQGINIDPKPPQPGDTRADIVRGFLVAMQATPIQTNTAKEFLTKSAAESWAPSETITYAGYPPVRESASGVSVTLEDPHWFDAQGAWRGTLPREQRTMELPMAFEDGEWRIDRAPDALIVPESWFTQRFSPLSLYYFDPTASILAPEPVYVPGGKQRATALTQALLLGPGEGLDRVVQSFIPPGLTVFSVPVSKGVAEIALRGDAGQLTPESIELMMAQFAWTLRQDPSITGLRVSINGESVPLPNGVSTYDVEGGSRYDPSGFQTSALLYGLRDGVLASGAGGDLTPVSGPLGANAVGLRSVGVDLTASYAAGVTSDGRSVVVGPVAGTKDDKLRTPLTGRNLLPPAWDHADRIWLIDRTAAGAVVSWMGLGANDRPHVLDVPGITGQQVRSFVVSRDGTRLVAVVQRPSGDEVLLSRIEHDRSGRVLGATPARPISDGTDSDLPIRAIAWQSPASLAILSPFPGTAALAQLQTASVDGSPVSSGRTVEGRFTRLAGSPDEDQALFGVSPRSLADLTTSPLKIVPLPDNTTSVTYVG